MSAVIKNYMVIILVIICIFTSLGIVSVAIDVHNARDFHGAVVNEIESSNHASSVIDTCKEAAEEMGMFLLFLLMQRKMIPTHKFQRLCSNTIIRYSSWKWKLKKKLSDMQDNKFCSGGDCEL
ncbi:MAG: hypothetical protein UGF89_01595 [Acutalibacteraceae bacterium]|nr:hypothetical protein [Acutalibacteraceae bacterium]